VFHFWELPYAAVILQDVLLVAEKHIGYRKIGPKCLVLLGSKCPVTFLNTVPSAM